MITTPVKEVKKEKDESVCDKNKCKMCIYGAGGAGNSYVTCDYILHTGHRRPCKAGKCTVFELRTGPYKPQSIPVIGGGLRYEWFE